MCYVERQSHGLAVKTHPLWALLEEGLAVSASAEIMNDILPAIISHYCIRR